MRALRVYSVHPERDKGHQNKIMSNRTASHQTIQWSKKVQVSFENLEIPNQHGRLKFSSFHRRRACHDMLHLQRLQGNFLSHSECALEFSSRLYLTVGLFKLNHSAHSLQFVSFATSAGVHQKMIQNNRNYL
jgi:hypothetical protein